MPHDAYGALYIHMPFCKSRCNYCDFTTRAVDCNSPEVSAYAEDIVMQIRRLAKQGELSELRTIYIGGGTPSYVAAALQSILYTLSLSVRFETLDEITVEANPDSLTERLVCDLWALGVNRLSIGVQSFDDGLLKMLGRAHTAQAARAAVRAAKSRFENVSVDLMCGLPGQTLEQFESDLHEALELGVSHVSVYPLTIELHTKMDALVLSGALVEPDDDVQAEMMQTAARVLTAGGLERYEVANYARPGFESKHNTAYWQGVPYLGLGQSAATMTQNEARRMRMQDGVVTDDLTPAQMMAEDLMLAMRMSKGVEVPKVSLAAQTLLPRAQQTFDELCAQGLVELDAGRYKPTEAGWLLGNELYGAIFDLA
jgi:oxygen-independent coproporphyrinogen-3 oxidase